MKKNQTTDTATDISQGLIEATRAIVGGILKVEAEKAIKMLHSYAASVLQTYSFGAPISELLAPEEKRKAKDRARKKLAHKAGKVHTSTRGAPQCTCDSYAHNGKHAAKCPAKREQRRRRIHTDQFKAKAVKAVAEGAYSRDAAKKFDINDSLLRKWCANAGVTVPVIPQDERRYQRRTK